MVITDFFFSRKKHANKKNAAITLLNAVAAMAITCRKAVRKRYFEIICQAVDPEM